MEAQTEAVNRNNCTKRLWTLNLAKPVSGAFEFPPPDIFDQNQVTFNLILRPTIYKHKPAGEIFNIRSDLNNEFRW